VGIGTPDADQDAKRRRRGEQVAADFAALAANPDNPDSLRAEYAIEAEWTRRRIEQQIGAYAVLPTETVDDRLLLDDADAPVELRFFGPANTHGDLMAWLPRQKVVATGDAVVAPTPYGFDVSAKPWLNALQSLQALPFDILIPGHGKVQRDRAYLRTLDWSMRDLLNRATAAAATGLTKEDAFARFDQREQQSRFGATQPWARKWLNDYWLEGMFGTAFDEAKGIPAPGK
jgi:glyoxylase-like metal-dependent hydrolase (beta-lactamase superfamily II)